MQGSSEKASLLMGNVSNWVNWLSSYTIQYQNCKLPDRVLRMKLTILELCLYTEVLSEQIHHHSLHVATDATSVPMKQNRPIRYIK